MVEFAGFCFVIADDSRARFVRAGPDNRLHTFRSVDASALRSDHDAPTKRLGRAVPPTEQRIPFLRLLAERVNADSAADLFTALVLVAPDAVLKELIALLDEAARLSLRGNLALNLVDTSDDALPPHLQAWLPPCTA